MTAILDGISLDDMGPDFLSASASADSEPLRCTADGCNNTLVKPARGRTPKFCEEHRATKSAATQSKARWANAEMVEKALETYIAGLGQLVQLVDPIDGSIIASGAKPVAHELTELGKIDKNLRKWLERVATPGKYGPLLMALVPIVVPIMAHHNLLPQFQLPGLTPESNEGVST